MSDSKAWPKAWVLVLTLTSLVMSARARATEFHLYPDCSGRPKAAVPQEMQGTFFASPDREAPEEFLMSVVAEGIASNNFRFRTEWPIGSKKMVDIPDGDLVKSGYCKYSEVATDPDGTTYLTTTLNHAQLNWWGYAQSNADFRVYYHPSEKTFGVAFRSNAFGFFLFFLPGGAGGGFGPERAVFKVAN